MGRALMSLALIGHGLVHLLGFVVNWKLATLAEMPYRTTVFAGALEVGEAGVRALGALWLLAALGFMGVGVGDLARRPWWRAVALGVTTLSLILCLLGWPESGFGLLINLGILVALASEEKGGRAWLSL
jgi:hypothetical protein